MVGSSSIQNSSTATTADVNGGGVTSSPTEILVETPAAEIEPTDLGVDPIVAQQLRTEAQTLGGNGRGTSTVTPDTALSPQLPAAVEAALDAVILARNIEEVNSAIEGLDAQSKQLLASELRAAAAQAQSEPTRARELEQKAEYVLSAVASAAPEDEGQRTRSAESRASILPHSNEAVPPHVNGQQYGFAERVRFNADAVQQPITSNNQVLQQGEISEAVVNRPDPRTQVGRDGRLLNSDGFLEYKSGMSWQIGTGVTGNGLPGFDASITFPSTTVTTGGDPAAFTHTTQWGVAGEVRFSGGGPSLQARRSETTSVLNEDNNTVQTTSFTYGGGISSSLSPSVGATHTKTNQAGWDSSVYFNQRNLSANISLAVPSVRAEFADYLVDQTGQNVRAGDDRAVENRFIAGVNPLTLVTVGGDVLVDRDNAVTIGAALGDLDRNKTLGMIPNLLQIIRIGNGQDGDRSAIVYPGRTEDAITGLRTGRQYPVDTVQLEGYDNSSFALGLPGVISISSNQYDGLTLRGPVQRGVNWIETLEPAVQAYWPVEPQRLDGFVQNAIRTLNQNNVAAPTVDQIYNQLIQSEDSRTLLTQSLQASVAQGAQLSEQQIVVFEERIRRQIELLRILPYGEWLDHSQNTVLLSQLAPDQASKLPEVVRREDGPLTAANLVNFVVNSPQTFERIKLYYRDQAAADPQNFEQQFIGRMTEMMPYAVRPQPLAMWAVNREWQDAVPAPVADLGNALATDRLSQSRDTQYDQYAQSTRNREDRSYEQVGVSYRTPYEVRIEEIDGQRVFSIVAAVELQERTQREYINRGQSPNQPDPNPYWNTGRSSTFVLPATQYQLVPPGMTDEQLRYEIAAGRIGSLPDGRTIREVNMAAAQALANSVHRVMTEQRSQYEVDSTGRTRDDRTLISYGQVDWLVNTPFGNQYGYEQVAATQSYNDVIEASLEQRRAEFRARSEQRVANQPSGQVSTVGTPDSAVAPSTGSQTTPDTSTVNPTDPVTQTTPGASAQPTATVSLQNVLTQVDSATSPEQVVVATANLSLQERAAVARALREGATQLQEQAQGQTGEQQQRVFQVVATLEAKARIVETGQVPQQLQPTAPGTSAVNPTVLTAQTTPGTGTEPQSETQDRPNRAPLPERIVAALQQVDRAADSQAVLAVYGDLLELERSQVATELMRAAQALQERAVQLSGQQQQQVLRAAQTLAEKSQLIATGQLSVPSQATPADQPSPETSQRIMSMLTAVDAAQLNNRAAVEAAVSQATPEEKALIVQTLRAAASQQRRVGQADDATVLEQKADIIVGQ
jgi:hypothetical protein